MPSTNHVVAYAIVDVDVDDATHSNTLSPPRKFESVGNYLKSDRNER